MIVSEKPSDSKVDSAERNDTLLTIRSQRKQVGASEERSGQEFIKDARLNELVIEELKALLKKGKSN